MIKVLIPQDFFKAQISLLFKPQPGPGVSSQNASDMFEEIKHKKLTL